MLLTQSSVISSADHYPIEQNGIAILDADENTKAVLVTTNYQDYWRRYKMIPTVNLSKCWEWLGQSTNFWQQSLEQKDWQSPAILSVKTVAYLDKGWSSNPSNKDAR